MENSKKTNQQVVLVLTPGRICDEALHWCYHQCTENKLNLRVVYLIDEVFSRQIEKTLADNGFIGDKPSRDLTQALDQEYQNRAKKFLDLVRKESHTFGLKPTLELIHGSYLDHCVAVGQRAETKVLVVIEKKSGFFSKIFKRDAFLEIKDQIKCELKVFGN